MNKKLTVPQIGWLIAICGLPFAGYLIPLDVWKAQTQWMHFWIVLLWAASFVWPGKSVNDPVLGAWILWTGAYHVSGWTNYLIGKDSFPAWTLLPLCHAISIVLAVYLAKSQWDEHFMSVLLPSIAGITIPLLILGVAQTLQFIGFPSFHHHVIGTMGNPNNFGAFLALCWPLFWIQKGSIWRVGEITLLAVLLMTLSRGALIAALAGRFYMEWKILPSRAWILLGIASLFGLCFMRLHGLTFGCPLRIAAWSEQFKLFLAHPLQGSGLGSIYQIFVNTRTGPAALWFHSHNESLQILIEQGIVGFSIFCWAVVRTWKLVSGGIFAPILIIALVNSLTNFTWHLWVTGIFVLIAYVGWNKKGLLNENA